MFKVKVERNVYHLTVVSVN